MTINEWISSARQALKAAGISNFYQEADWILEEITGLKKKDQLLNPLKVIENEKLLKLNEILKKRQTRYPLQYLLHKAYFMDLLFYVDETVLIPRPETEVLVNWCIQNINPGSKVLDIGTGSGCIPVALKYYRPDLNIFSLDISPSAIETAKKNEISVLKKPSISWICSNLFDSLKEKDFDAIISNPPYLNAEEMAEIEPELLHEPKNALLAEENGLFFYRRIASHAPGFLINQGLVALEIGKGQQNEIQKAFSAYKQKETHEDLEKIIRVLVFQFVKDCP